MRGCFGQTSRVNTKFEISKESPPTRGRALNIALFYFTFLLYPSYLAQLTVLPLYLTDFCNHSHFAARCQGYFRYAFTVSSITARERTS